MTVTVEIYRAPEYERVGRIPLGPLLREVFEPVLKLDLSSARFLLQLSAVDDGEVVSGFPTMVNLRSSHGYGKVTIVDDQGQVIYQHPHAVSEIVAVPLQRHLARRFPDVDHWGFGLVGQGLEALALVRPTPQVSGGVSIDSARRRRGTSHVEEIPEAEPSATTLEDLEVADPSTPHAGPVDHSTDAPAPPMAVVLRPTAYSALTERAFSTEVEEGGFVIGHRYRDRSRPGRYLVEVTAVARAESTGASLLRFTFTGESFLQLGNLLARRGADEEILGWYHTHLFPATVDFGLSTIDVRLHTTTFRRPWQVAALVNLGSGQRVLRWYGVAGDGTGLAEVPYWLVTDSRPSGVAASGGPSPIPTASES